MNCVTLIGRWTKDLELNFVPGSGKAVAKGTLAVDRRFSKDGQKEADFIPIVIWGKIAESAANHTGKGKLCAIKGSINTRNYEAKDGNKRYVTEVVADEVQFLEWASSQGGNQFGGFNQDFSAGNFNSDITPVDDGDIPF